jgi:hypothetical protein
LVDHIKLAILFLTGAEISHICREYLTLKIVKRQISKIHRVQHNTVTTCSISPLSTCYDRIMLRYAQPFIQLRTSYISIRWWYPICTRPTPWVGFLNLSSLKQRSAVDYHSTPDSEPTSLYSCSGSLMLSLAEEQQKPILSSVVWPDLSSKPRYTKLEARTLTIIPSRYFYIYTSNIWNDIGPKGVWSTQVSLKSFDKGKKNPSIFLWSPKYIVYHCEFYVYWFEYIFFSSYIENNLDEYLYCELRGDYEFWLRLVLILSRFSLYTCAYWEDFSYFS